MLTTVTIICKNCKNYKEHQIASKVIFADILIILKQVESDNDILFYWYADNRDERVGIFYF